MHDYHDALPGYHPDQLLHDGCGECEARSAREDHGLSNLDLSNFRRAWIRAYRWNHTSAQCHISHAEAPLMSTLWIFQVHLERLGWPLGTIPYGDRWGTRG